jgi:hypothetical protein
VYTYGTGQTTNCTVTDTLSTVLCCFARLLGFLGQKIPSVHFSFWICKLNVAIAFALKWRHILLVSTTCTALCAILGMHIVTDRMHTVTDRVNCNGHDAPHCNGQDALHRNVQDELQCNGQDARRLERFFSYKTPEATLFVVNLLQKENMLK